MKQSRADEVPQVGAPLVRDCFAGARNDDVYSRHCFADARDDGRGLLRSLARCAAGTLVISDFRYDCAAGCLCCQLLPILPPVKALTTR